MLKKAPFNIPLPWLVHVICLSRKGKVAGLFFFLIKLLFCTMCSVVRAETETFASFHPVQVNGWKVLYMYSTSA